MMQKKWESAFRARFTKYEEELRGYYMELYHNDEAAWDYFTEMLYSAWKTAA